MASPEFNMEGMYHLSKRGISQNRDQLWILMKSNTLPIEKMYSPNSAGVRVLKGNNLLEPVHAECLRTDSSYIVRIIFIFKGGPLLLHK